MKIEVVNNISIFVDDNIKQSIIDNGLLVNEISLKMALQNAIEKVVHEIYTRNTCPVIRTTMEYK